MDLEALVTDIAEAAAGSVRPTLPTTGAAVALRMG